MKFNGMNGTYNKTMNEFLSQNLRLEHFHFEL